MKAPGTYTRLKAEFRTLDLEDVISLYIEANTGVDNMESIPKEALNDIYNSINAIEDWINKNSVS